MNEFRRITKGAMWVFLASVISAGFGYLSKVFLARILGPAEYGLFVLSMTVMYILSSFAQSGISSAVAYFIPKYRKSKKLPSIISTIFWLVSLSILIIGLFILLFPNEVALMFGESKLISVLPYIAILLIVYTYTSLFNNIFRSYENAKIPQLINILRASFFISFGVAVTYLYKSALTPIIAYIIIYLFLLSTLVYLSRKLIKFSHPKKEYFNEILLFSLSMFLVGIMSLILRWTDVWMISLFMDTKYVGIYNVATSTAFLLNFFIGGFLYLYFPIATRLLSEGKKKKVRELASKVVFWNTLIISPIFFLMAVFSKQLVNILFGKQYILAAVPLVILSSILFFRNVVSTVANNLLAMNKKRVIMAAASVAALVNIVLNYLFIPIYGLVGAATATAIALFVNRILLFFYARREKLSPVYEVRHVLPIFIAFILVLPIFILSILYSFNLAESILIGVLYLISYVAVIHFRLVNLKNFVKNINRTLL